jgi:homoserine/homoserine lactone efflux protein
MTLSLLGVGALLSANALGYAFLASRARSMVRNSHAVRMLNRAGGALLIGAGMATATIRAAQN